MPLTSRLPPLLCAAALFAASAAPAAPAFRRDSSRSHSTHSTPAVKSGPNITLALAGGLLLAGGGAFAYHQNREADRDMRMYRGSAFTGNTGDYKDRVRGHERNTWVGLAGAALGGLLVVVSF